MRTIISCEENENENHNEILTYTAENQWSSRPTVPRAGEEVAGPSHPGGGKGHGHCETVWMKTDIHTEICMYMFRGALFLITKN